MDTPPSTQRKHKSKKSKRAAQNSPGAARSAGKRRSNRLYLLYRRPLPHNYMLCWTGHQWVCHHGNTQFLVPSGKSDCYGVLEGVIDIDSALCNGRFPGGFISAPSSHLYSTVTSVEHADLSKSTSGQRVHLKGQRSNTQSHIVTAWLVSCRWPYSTSLRQYPGAPRNHGNMSPTHCISCGGHKSVQHCFGRGRSWRRVAGRGGGGEGCCVQGVASGQPPSGR